VLTTEGQQASTDERDEFRIQYTEPGTPWACGWHQDETHEQLGSSHFQVDHEAWAAPHHETASFTDPNPMAIIETSLSELWERVPTLPDLLSRSHKPNWALTGQADGFHLPELASN